MPMMRPRYFRHPFPMFLFVGLVLLGVDGLHAQCGIPISSFPYQEGFEDAPAWTSGGSGNDWAWGTPAHPLINSAGGGSKSWCVGGLSGTFYNNNESSWLESPCFNFGALSRPRISFKIFWQVERQYDGMTFQYSTDGGGTYHNVGSFTDEPDCNTAHWFNTPHINYLPSTISPKHGWSGTVNPTQGSCQGGGGSGEWVTAKHCLEGLAGEPSVRFRFYFAAGSTCNSYDGIAIDDILIDESDPVVASFSGDCQGNTVEFINTSTPCPDQFLWDLGDTGSPGNTSTEQHPTHTYATPGTYTVTLTATDACGATATTNQQLHILGVTIDPTPPTCGQDNGALEATVEGADGPVAYLWTPGGATTSTLNGVGAGEYTVSVSAPNSCGASATVTLVASDSDLSLDLAHTDVSCAGQNDGTATAMASGGDQPLAFEWQPGGSTATGLTDLPPGSVTCTVTDGQGCAITQSILIQEPMPVAVQPMSDTTVCEGASVILEATASGGSGDYVFTWSPDGPAVAPAASTTYTVTATDAQGCSSIPAEVQVNVSTAFVPAFLISDSVGCSPLCVTFDPQPAGAADYHWAFGDGQTSDSPAPTHCYTEGGSFTVALSITDDTGCTGQISMPGRVLVHPSPEVQFNATPPVTTIEQPSVHFANATSHADGFSWHFGDPANSTTTEPLPNFTFPGVGCYTVSLAAFNEEGCSAMHTSQVCVEESFMLFIPNAFTPDQDGHNDVFRPITSVQAPKEYRLMVFNRWGDQVFGTTDLYQGWDGHDAPDGIYGWALRITDALGRPHERAGHVVLLR